MSIVSRTADLFYAFRFLKLLVTPWNKMEAFDLGVIDDQGKTLKKAVGVGGSIKNREIIIQGNYRDQVMKILTDMGHNVKRIGG